MMIATTNGSSASIQDYYSRFHYRPSLDTTLGGTEDLTDISGGVNKIGYVDLKFSRKLDTGDKFDEVIVADKEIDICWAHKEGTLGITQHGEVRGTDIGSARFIFATRQENRLFVRYGVDPVTDLHVQLMSVCWGVIAPIGVIAARYFKWSSWWIYLHILCFTMIILATVINSSQQYIYDQVFLVTLTDEKLLSSRLGFSIITLCGAQGLFGLCTMYYRQNTKNFQAAAFLSRAHKGIGWALVIAGLFSIFTGHKNLGGEIAAYALMACLIGLFEVLFIAFNYFNNHSFCMKQLKNMTHEEVFEDIQKGKEYVFADHLVINVAHFKRSHPGGQFMITAALGEDVGKYMAGCSSYGDRFQPYIHSETSFSMLRYLAVGIVPYPPGYLAPTAPGTDQDSMEFQIYSQQQLSDNVWLLTLKSNFFEMNDNCRVCWLGKHFKLCNYKKALYKIRRYYSGVFVNLGLWGRELGIEIPGENECPGAVKLIYKAYPGGSMTQHLFGMKRGDIINLQGPLGPGLMISELKGSFLAFAGGTGLVPFLDLLYLIWKQREELIEFSFTLYISCRTWNDGICLELIERMQQKISSEILRVTILTSEKNKVSLESVIESLTAEDYQKVWICGPSGYMRTVHTLLVENKVKESSIILM